MTTLMKSGGGVRFDSYETGWRLAKAIVAAGMQPKSFGAGEKACCACFVAMQAGAEIGLSPMQSIQNIAVINGKPGIYGPAALALVEASGKVDDLDEKVEGDGDKRTATVLVKRIGRRARTFTFSVADAKKAQLWGKQGPWSQYPDRMLIARARGFALRDVFPDVLLGATYTIEELSEGSSETVEQLSSAVVQQAVAGAPLAKGVLGDFMDGALEAAADQPSESTNDSETDTIDSE